MPALIIFLFKVNVALILFCAGYYLVLRPLTFYSLNRAYLVAAIIFASVYPYIDLTAFAERHSKLAKPVQVVIYNWQMPAREILDKPDYWQWATVLFWVGVVILGIRFIMQLFSLYMLYRNSIPQRINNHDVRVISGEAAPFSFWKSIYINPANHSGQDLDAILQHEQIHVNGWHTMDILLAEISCVFYWFNPGIWLMKKAVRENIEFITDRKVLNDGADSKRYQYSLVNVSFNNTTPGIVNHFNLSTIKKRIIMMNAKRSSKANLTRYAFVIPVVVCSLLVFTISKADVAKPLTIKLTNAIKPMTTAIKEAAKDAGITFTDTVPAKKFVTKRDTGNRKVTQVYLMKSDTVKKAAFVIKMDKEHSLDSMRIVVDGKRISKEEMAKLDPNKIAGVTIMKGDAAKAEAQTVSIITKDSEEGKAVMKNSAIENPITRITINGVAKDPAKLTDKEKELIARMPPTKGVVSNIVITQAGSATLANKGDQVIIDGKPAKNTIMIRLDSAKYKAEGTAKTSDVLILNDKPSTFGLQGAVGVQNYPATITLRNSFDKISDKVIVIDDKVASEKEMKKLSAYDIDSMSISRGNSSEAIEKYGEKAKNGIVYITTKKGKN
ncbi:hypothetical protein FPZ42_08365 [Mucilaginibacter achroorhodeus]|uniref:Peptidase M56 domain-containing protein n=1 Tax=Mucilaginibacter achroorhodeus TaxID=2599294 RepID=A0A563U6Q9_9SPHI|nr:M56 family metallopeptidase [Mucilaginibacter achroorhodeus]TWR27037.1 hypothetical protein FPZ42_08365 [Mucilaginibacter achroorhodeus]